ncbi:MAG: type II secretion system protein [Prosthecobacter sp.]|uniref:type II secretion system protein n=1 Tax=Prosthecobacter sp. TaxID=1965333 RepID=UPI003900182F
MKTILQSSVRRPNRSGFSLFEVLMLIAVLGVILGITVPMLSHNGSVYAARDRRNAQELSSTSIMAQAAGLNFVQGEDVFDTVRAIVRGGMPVRGALKGKVFVVPGLSEEDIQGAAKYLRIQNGELLYTNSETVQSGGQRM